MMQCVVVENFWGNTTCLPKQLQVFCFFFLTEKNSEALECYFALQEIQAMGFLHVGLGKSEMFLNIVPYLFRKKS